MIPQNNRGKDQHNPIGRVKSFGALMVSALILFSPFIILLISGFGWQMGGLGSALAFISYQAVGLALVTLVTVLVFLRLRHGDLAEDRQNRDRLMQADAGAAVAVTICIPCHNEEHSIVPTLRAILAQKSPAQQIIVVNDSSTDGTLASLDRAFSLKPGKALADQLPKGVRVHTTSEPSLCVIDAPKSGKAQALNIGLALAKMPLFASVDADTRLAPEALGIVTEKFNGGPDIISVAGIVIPTRHNAGQDGAVRCSWLIPYQSLEYAIDFAYRLGWETVNGAHIMSGAFTLFKTGLLRDVGGFNSRTLTEDYEIIHRLRAHCSDHGIAHRILTAPSAMAYTNAPVRLGVFLRQRVRWFQGFLQTQLAYRHLIGRFKYGWFGALTMPLKSIDAISPLIVFVALLSFAFSDNDTTICIASLFLISGGIRLLIDWATGAVTMLRRHGRVAPYESPAKLARMILLMPVYFVINRVLWLVIGTTAYGRLLTGSRRW